MTRKPNAKGSAAALASKQERPVHGHAVAHDAQSEGVSLEWMREFAGTIKTYPADFAERHDDYRLRRKSR